MSNLSFNVVTFQGKPLEPNRKGTLEVAIEGDRATGTLRVEGLNDPIPLEGAVKEDYKRQELTLNGKTSELEGTFVLTLSNDDFVGTTYVAGMCVVLETEVREWLPWVLQGYTE